MKSFNLISLKKAIDLISKEKKQLCKISKIKITDSLNLVAAENIISPISLPSLDCAGLDGFVFHKSKKLKLPISKSTITPGKLDRNYSNNYAYRINTGAIIPKDFSNFISIENAFNDNRYLYLNKSKISNKDIKKKGEDLKKGKILLKKNEKINFIKISLLSSVGISTIKVFSLLKVGVVSNGNELVKTGKSKRKEQVYDSNKLQIINFLKGYNLLVKDLGILRDNEKDIDNFYKKNIQKFDLIISSGGSSFSSGDLISSFLQKKTKIIFKYVRIQPGRPVIFSKYKSNFIFSLPGNPLAVLVNLIFLVSFFINPIADKIKPNSQKIKSAFSDTKKTNITKFYRVKIKNNKAYLQNSKGSAKLISAAESDGLILVNERVKIVRKGDIYEFFRFET